MGNSNSARNEDRSNSDETSFLTMYQIKTMQRAWQHMSKAGQASCGRQIITKVYKKEPVIRKVFQHSNVINLLVSGTGQESCGILQHGEEIVLFLTYIINNLSDMSIVEDKCEAVGNSHRKMKQFGMKVEHWDIMGEALSETIREIHGWRKNRQLLKASNILASFIVDRMRTGFMQKDTIYDAFGNKKTINLSPEEGTNIPKHDFNNNHNGRRSTTTSQMMSTSSNGGIDSTIKSPDYTILKQERTKKANRAQSFDVNSKAGRRVLPQPPHIYSIYSSPEWGHHRGVKNGKVVNNNTSLPPPTPLRSLFVEGRDERYHYSGDVPTPTISFLVKTTAGKLNCENNTTYSREK